MLVGGHGKGVIDRVLAFGDEWLPNRVGDDERIRARIARLRNAGEEAGRGPIPTTLALVNRAGPEVLEPYEAAGVHRGVFYLGPSDEAEAERRLDRYAARMREYDGG